MEIKRVNNSRVLLIIWISSNANISIKAEILCGVYRCVNTMPKKKNISNYLREAICSPLIWDG